MSNFGEYNKDRNAFVYAGEPLVFQSDVYNNFLLKSIEESKNHIDVYTILINSAHEVVYAQWSEYFEEHHHMEIDERKKIIEDYYSFCGFGKIVLRGVTPKGGHVETPYEHYASGWKKNNEQREEGETGVSFFTIGFLCGATEAIYDIPLGTFAGKQVKCLSKGDDTCRFEIFRGLKKKLHKSPAEGIPQSFEASANVSDANIDYDSVRDSIIGMKMKGKHESGLIESFGVLFVRHYANYYCLVAIRMMIELEKKSGKEGIGMAKSMMQEAGNICAFHTLGAIMTSSEWETIIEPNIKNQDDWLHGILACINGLGWGKWEVESIDATGETIFNITGGYESNSFLKLVGKSKEPICYFLQGTLAGIMNLIYHSDITKKPTLDKDFYNLTFGNSPDRFESTAVATRMMGFDSDKIIVKKRA
jgi:predicted hydrocarbon binding protein